MPEFILTICNPKTGKSYNKRLDTDAFKGKKINDVVSGNDIGLSGYELKVTGGSDKCGFPMRSDLEGTQRRKILASKSLGIHIKRNGMRKRKNIAGNQINLNTSQVNLNIVKFGEKDIEEALGVKKEEDKAAE